MRDELGFLRWRWQIPGGTVGAKAGAGTPEDGFRRAWDPGAVGDKSESRVGAGVEAWWWLWGLRCVLRAQGNHGRLLSRAGACVCLCARPLPDLPLGKLFGGSIALTVPLV